MRNIKYHVLPGITRIDFLRKFTNFLVWLLIIKCSKLSDTCLIPGLDTNALQYNVLFKHFLLYIA